MITLVLGLKLTLVGLFSLCYLSCIILFYKTGYDYSKINIFTIIDNANYSYVEYISDFIFTTDKNEKIIRNMNKSLINKAFYYKKLPLSNYKKNIYCTCYTNEKGNITINDINTCYIKKCDIKINENENDYNIIYKWNNSLIYANVSRYYINQGINLKTQKCDEKLGFISCGIYENINTNTEICVKNNSMNCPFKISNNINNRNILFNNIDIMFAVNDIQNYELSENINLFDIFSNLKIQKNNNNTDFIFIEEIKNLFIESKLGFPFKFKNNTDKVYIIPNNDNNSLLYNNNIILNDNNFFQINYELIPFFHKNQTYNGITLILTIIMSFYLIYIVLIKNLYFHVLNMLALIDTLFNGAYDSIFTNNKFDYSYVKIILFVQIFDSPFFFYLIYNLRKIKKKYEDHIWDDVFVKQLQSEKNFYKVNLILLFMSLISLVIYSSSFIKLYFKQKNKLVEIK